MNDDRKKDSYKKHGEKRRKESGSYGGGHLKLPHDYLNAGYFDENGCLKQALLTDVASQVAKSFGTKMKNSQLRKFYGHLRIAEKAFMFTKDEHKLIIDTKALDSFVAEAKGKEKVPQNFYIFIRKNVNAANTQKDVLKGLLPHFQAVVAYFTYHYPKSK